MRKQVFFAFAAFALAASVRGEANPLAGISFDVPQTWPCKELTGPGHRAIWVQGESWSGMPTRVFAYVVLPEGASAARKVPGVVLAHGGLGTAYLSWAETWAKHGYAAIVPDTCGALPIRITGEKRAELRWARTGVGGPHGWGRYDLADEAPGDQWPYHAVGALVRCHSYLRALPEVDAEKTGLVGISWGGFLTMLAAAHDTRFKFAMPVYTCAFFDELEKYGPNRDRASFPRHLLDRWGALFDPKHYVPKMTMPAMWFASTNDSYFPFDLLQRTAALLPRRAQLAVRVRMAHSHGAHGENMPELFRFADSIVRGGRPLPEVERPALEGDKVSVRFDAKGQALKRFDLIWCTNAQPVAATEWQVKAYPVPSGKVFTAPLPAGATRVYVNAVLEGDSGEEVYPETLVSSPALSVATVEPVAAPDGKSLEAKIAAKHRILVSDQWGGGHRIIFDFNGRKGWVVEPKEPAAGRPWVWTMQWMGAFLERTGAPSIVRAGGYHVHLAAFDTRGDDEGLKVLAEFQDYLTGELGLAPKARLIGMSWGGFYSVRYASAYPEKVASIYLDAPLLNAYTLPNLTVTNAVEDAKVIGPWAASRPSGDIADDPRQAVNLAEKVAAAGIPILLLYGGVDQTVDPARNCELFIPRFKAAGGRIEVKCRSYYGHHPHGVDITDVSEITDFFGLPARVEVPSVR